MITVQQETLIQYIKRLIKENNANPFKAWGVWFKYTDKLRFIDKVRNLHKNDVNRKIKNDNR